MILFPALSALLNVVLLAGIPFGGYWLVQRLRHGRSLAECARRVGLTVGEPRYLGWAALFAAAAVGALLVWPPPVEPMLREGSAMAQFEGLGLGGASVTAALLYGVVKTGFAEELLFRGLIAGALGRRLELRWANLLQGTIFLLPHLPLLYLMPELWGIVVIGFVGGLVMGWLRLRSGSILAPWLLHASGNVAVALSLAVRTAA